MSSFTECLRKQIIIHPSMRPRDVVKLCYQAAFGAEHLLSDIGAAWAYFFTEFEATNEIGQELYERISPDFIRVNLAEWKRRKIPGEWLFSMFERSAGLNENGGSVFSGLLAEAGALIHELPFPQSEWQCFVDEYMINGVRAVHHSEEYREKEKPHYRIARAEYLRVIPVLERIAGLENNNTVVVVAIDGRAASGKTTLALRLEEITGAGVAHTDDFFLPVELRNESRLAEPGGNIHYERFITELMPKLRCCEAFCYDVFDCGKMMISGKREVSASRFRIVEGSYSLHPKFGGYADIRVFSDITPAAQWERVKKRDGERSEDFAARWVPMEEAYFDAFDIRGGADIIIDN